MTTYNPPTDAELDPEAPWTSDKAKRLRDVGIAISEGASGAPKIQTAALDNLSVTTAKIAALAVTGAKIAASTIEQANLAADCVGTSQIKVLSGTVSGAGTQPAPGGWYGFYPKLKNSGSNTTFWGASGYAAQVAGTTYETTINLSASGGTPYATQYYVAACPPYDHGDGLIPQFVFALIDKATLNVDAAWAAPEAPWHNNGPTNIHADYYDGMGRGWRWNDVREMVVKPEDLSDYIGSAKAAGWSRILPEDASFDRWVLHGELETFTNGSERSCAKTWKELCEERGISVEIVLGDAVPGYEIAGKERIEITQAIKRADMRLIPHPFRHFDLTGKVVVMLDPVADNTWRLADLHESHDVSPNELLHMDYLRIGNDALNRAGPPGVMVVPYRWKLT